MKFAKMHGLGNDFVVVDCLDRPLAEPDLPGLARRVCDRHFGVGADGLVLVLRSREADFRMRILNSDGSEAEHCGNAIRCVGKFLFERGYLRDDEIIIETTGRVNPVLLEVAGGRVERVRVDMGEPVFQRSAIPVAGAPDSEAIDEPLEVARRTLRFTCVSMGNPHAVTFVDDVGDYPVPEVGPLVEHHPSFPRRTNTEFVQVLGPAELRMRVWERGAGETLACGTGACASLVAASRTGRAGRSAVVHLRGGDLHIEWADNNHVFMTGPAVEVYTGEWLD